MLKRLSKASTDFGIVTMFVTEPKMPLKKSCKNAKKDRIREAKFSYKKKMKMKMRNRIKLKKSYRIV